MALLGSTAQCFNGSEGCKNVFSIPDKTAGFSDLPAFLNEMMANNSKLKPVPYQNLPKGVSNIYISRISIGAARKGIVFTKQ
jgi:hypothetical protein